MPRFGALWVIKLYSKNTLPKSHKAGALNLASTGSGSWKCWFVRALTGRLELERGMSLWYDMKDWVGGYSFEVARPETIFRFYRDKGFALREMKTTRSHGCNEFVFVREAPD
jgi:hypothetical protein